MHSPMPVYTSDDLMRCKPDSGCTCAWYSTAEIVCRGECIGEHDICPWLMVCRCINPENTEKRGRQLERLVLDQPPDVQTSPVAVSRHRIRLGEYDIRQERDQEAIRRIADSIRERGLFAPPGGVAAKDGHIDLLMGHNRVLAVLSILEWSEIPIRVFHWWSAGQATDRWARKIAAFQENTIREQMTFDEEVRLVHAYWRETGQTVREIAVRFHMSRSWVQERINWGRSIATVETNKPDKNRPQEPAKPARIESTAAQLYAAASEKADRSESDERKSAAPERVTFSVQEINTWIDALKTKGIAIADGDDIKKRWRNTINNLVLYSGQRKGRKHK